MSEPRKNDQPRQRAWGLSLILLLPLMCGVIYGASQLGAFQAPAGLLVGQVTPIETADYQAWNEIVFAPVDDGLLTQIAAEANGEVLEIAGVATARPTVARDEPVGIPMVFSATDVRDATPQSIVAIANVTGDDNSTSSDDDGDTQSDNDTSASAGNGSTTRGAGISADDIFVEATEGSVAVAQAPTEFIAPSDTPMPTDAPTETPRPSETPVPTDMDTVTPAPTNTLAPTNTPIPTNTAVPAPRINFAASPQSGDAPLTVNFTDLSGGAITSYSWSFGDGTTSTLASPTHTYSTAGDYYVRFEVTGPGGTVAAGVTISVGNPVPDTPIPPTPVPDSDGDGILDANDVCPNTGNQGFGVDGVGCPNPTPAPDTDGDGFNDDVDICPNLADFGFGMNPDAPGCPNPTPVPDSDGDGFNDSVDACPNQGDAGFGVDGTGCPNPAPPPPDRDNDGVPDATDACPDDGDAGFGVDGTGCPNPPPPPPDRDNDGVPDATDACPDDGDAGFGV
ncbi:MAG: PKD domain-containing protein, partial [Chloroflexota bacterium]